jgi:4-amino-4-deoxy-L-arabinose transferase-like glycosyltransferase
LLPNGKVVESPPNYIRLDVARPWYEMWTNASGDVHPPLFYLVLRLWREIVPDSDAWIRGLPALLSVIAIGLLFLAIHTHAGPVPALWASALMALAGVQIEYAQECRSYPLMLVCLLGTAAAVLRIERYGFHWRRGIAVGIGALAAAMTHYLAFPILIVLGLYVLWQLRGRDRKNTVICFAVAGLGFCALWMPWMLEQKGGFWGKIAFTKEPAWTLGLWLYSWASLPTRFLVNSTSANPIARWCGVAWFVLPLLLLVRQPRSARPLLFWWMWLTLGAAAVAIGDLGRNGKLLTISRYTLMVSPAAYALGGLMLAHRRGWQRHIIPALLCAGCIAALPGAYLRYKADWRSLGGYVAAHLSRDDILVMYDPPDIAWRIRCDLIGMQYYDRELDVPIVLLSAPPSDSLEQRIGRARSVWFFTSYPGATVEPILPGARVVERCGVPALGTLDRVEWSGTAAP